MMNARRTSRCLGIGMPSVKAVPRSAVAWIDGRHATIARISEEGRIATSAIERGLDAESTYLANVVQAIGDQERLMILGPSSARLMLERDYVAIHRRPDHLVVVELANVVAEPELIDRLHEFARPFAA
jgi:hypothetical protein